MSLPPLPNNEGFTLTERVFQALKQGILSLAIKPREHLIIGDVAKAYGISRTPVREALIMLEREGWVENDRRRGARVTAPSARAILDLVEIQGVLEGYIARRATEILSDADIQHAETILDQAEEAMQADDHEYSRHLGIEFHAFLAKKVGNQHMRTTIEQLEDHMDRVRPLLWSQGRAPIEKSTQQHRQILNAIKERNAAKAERLMFHHLVWFEEELAATLQHVLG